MFKSMGRQASSSVQAPMYSVGTSADGMRSSNNSSGSGFIVPGQHAQNHHTQRQQQWRPSPTATPSQAPTYAAARLGFGDSRGGGSQGSGPRSSGGIGLAQQQIQQSHQLQAPAYPPHHQNHPCGARISVAQRIINHPAWRLLTSQEQLNWARAGPFEQVAMGVADIISDNNHAILLRSGRDFVQQIAGAGNISLLGSVRALMQRHYRVSVVLLLGTTGDITDQLRAAIVLAQQNGVIIGDVVRSPAEAAAQISQILRD